jgi:DNA gyrase inhibitor GyrI
MNGCCLVALLLLISPRLLLVGVWLFTNWYNAFDSIVVAVLGWMFLPYTSLAWMYTFFNNGGRIEGGYLVLLILGVLFDIGVFSAGRRSMKNSPASVPGDPCTSTTKDGGQTMEVRFEKRNPLRVAFVRHVGPYQECGAAWEILCVFAAQHGLFSPTTLRIGIGHDNPDVTPPEKLRYDACVTVDDQFQATGEVGVQELPGGQYAILTLKGPYSGLPEAYRWLFYDWLPRSGRELRSAPCFEVYVSNPASTAPEDLVTEIYLPLEE